MKSHLIVPATMAAVALPSCKQAGQTAEVMQSVTTLCESTQHSVTPFRYVISSDMKLKVINAAEGKLVAELAATAKKNAKAKLSGRDVEMMYDARSGTGNGIFVYKLLSDGKMYLKHDGQGDMVPVTCGGGGGTHPVDNPAGRPPQYVALAFDGSYSMPIWKDVRKFATDNKGTVNVKYSIFISCVYYLWRTGPGDKAHSSMKYGEGVKGAGQSAIGFGDSAADVLQRMEQTNLAVSEGHEIASHLCGHYNGNDFSSSQWDKEFSYFRDIMGDVAGKNSLTIPADKKARFQQFDVKKVIGLRTPELGKNASLWPLVAKYGYKYDTSLDGHPLNYWPYKNSQGTWMFPLAVIPIAGTNKSTFSMDYNFYMTHSKAQDVSDKGLQKQFEDQMYNSYVSYFNTNYYGNRAPVHIGHHFSPWNGGAYMNAMKRFIKYACSKPEVKCDTYTDLMNYMNTLSPAQIAKFKAGDFPKMPKNLSLAGDTNEPSNLMIDVKDLSPDKRYTKEELDAMGLVVPPAVMKH